MKLLWIDEHDAVTRSMWDKSHALAGAALQQHWAYGSAMQALGVPCLRCVVMDQGEPVAFAQFLVRNWFGIFSIALCTRGPVWLGASAAPSTPAYLNQVIFRREVHRLIHRSLPQRELRLVLFSPDFSDATEAGVDRLHRVMTGYATVMMDIADEPELLRERLPGSWKNRLQVAERSALKVERVGSKPSQYQWLLDRDAAMQQKKGYESLPMNFVPVYQSVSRNGTYSEGSAGVPTASPKGARSPRKSAGRVEDALFTVRADRDGEPVAAMMFLRHGSVATYQVGWSDPLKRLPGAHNLLLWNAMLQLRQSGIRRMDLGGVNTGRSAGVARFKIGTGGKVVVLAGTYLAL